MDLIQIVSVLPLLVAVLATVLPIRLRDRVALLLLSSGLLLIGLLKYSSKLIPVLMLVLMLI